MASSMSFMAEWSACLPRPMLSEFSLRKASHPSVFMNCPMKRKAWISGF